VIVVDASAIGELLTGDETQSREVARLLSAQRDVAAPEVIDLEISSMLSRQARMRMVTRSEADALLEDYLDIGVQLFPHRAILRRAWQLAYTVSVYDAAYVALAEALDAPLVTCDHRLARATGHSVAIIYAG
jgi:predicted nucleic acid-binding protein